MKRLSIRSSWISVHLLIVGFAKGKAMAQAGDVVVHAAIVDLTHFTGTEPVDQIDMTTTFTNNEFKELRHCEAADSLILHGVKVGVQQGLCGSATHITNMTIPFFKPLSSTLAGLKRADRSPRALHSPSRSQRLRLKRWTPSCR